MIVISFVLSSFSTMSAMGIFQYYNLERGWLDFLKDGKDSSSCLSSGLLVSMD